LWFIKRKKKKSALHKIPALPLPAQPETWRILLTIAGPWVGFLQPVVCGSGCQNGQYLACPDPCPPLHAIRFSIDFLNSSIDQRIKISFPMYRLINFLFRESYLSCMQLVAIFFFFKNSIARYAFTNINSIQSFVERSGCHVLHIMKFVH
jgi:hypothetical protein